MAELQKTVSNQAAQDLGLPRSRDQMRANIFASKQVKIKIVDFFGEKIELRQPVLADILAAKEKDTQDGVIGMLVDYAYVPGTDQKVFEPTDRDGLLQLPFGNDFLDVSNALEELTNVNFQVKGAS